MLEPWYSDSELKDIIEHIILKTFLYKKDFEKAKNQGRAQLWIALALIDKKIEELRERIIRIESTFKKLKKKENKTGMDKSEIKSEVKNKVIAGDRKNKRSKRRVIKKFRKK